MKRLPIISFFLFLIFYSLLITPALSQEYDFTRAYNDYLYNYNQYRAAHTEYAAAKQQYLAYKTLTSKTTALEKTKKMLETRDETTRTYLLALRLKLNETSGVSPYEQQIVKLRLNNEISWYESHRYTVTSAGTIPDLVDLSQEAQERYQETEVIAYQTLGTILAGKESFLRDQVQEQINTLEDKMAQIRQEGKIDTKTLERWLLEAQNRLTLSKEKQFAAQSLLAQLKVREQNKGRVYSEAQDNLTESHQYLKEANSYLLEIIRELKGD
jgi:hypothetical protein